MPKIAPALLGLALVGLGWPLASLANELPPLLPKLVVSEAALARTYSDPQRPQVVVYLKNLPLVIIATTPDREVAQTLAEQTAAALNQAQNRVLTGPLVVRQDSGTLEIHTSDDQLLLTLNEQVRGPAGTRGAVLAESLVQRISAALALPVPVTAPTLTAPPQAAPAPVQVAVQPLPVKAPASPLEQITERIKDFIIQSFQGHASWYGGQFQGRRGANGEIHRGKDLTAAHRSLPFGTRLKVTNLQNGRQVVLKVTDRGPFVGGRVIDVSQAAAQTLGMIHMGVARVRVEVLGRKS
ncbi:septal ring lytic transglycosylase RlpA family protein [Candidatus Cyanaurora vandensis]|uniref:septal ring lytic transglycosylase RlpA family protein n=1 Tax=Candidatus Cyanaurora vandensis TaxID=2714958 RepID=UPI00257A2421|nr:septal ring lytic transglycosylase RlpA family protein [Candidatus Cyanaurora vandensis]